MLDQWQIMCVLILDNEVSMVRKHVKVHVRG